MDGASVDTHLCIRCNETIVGIGAYLDHRRGDCLANGGPSSSQGHIVDPPHGGGLSHAPASEGCPRDVPDIPFLPDVPELPDFFLSLDLQRYVIVMHGTRKAQTDCETLLRKPHANTDGNANGSHQDLFFNRRKRCIASVNICWIPIVFL